MSASAFGPLSASGTSMIKAPVIAVRVVILPVISTSDRRILPRTSAMVAAYCPRGHVRTTAEILEALLLGTFLVRGADCFAPPLLPLAGEFLAGAEA